MTMASVVVYSEEESWGKQLLTAAKELGDPILFTFNRNTAEKLSGVYTRTYYVKIDAFDPVAISEALKDVVNKETASILLFPCTNKGRMIAGLISGVLGFGTVTDAVSVVKTGEGLEVEKLTFGGNALAKIKVEGKTSICIVSGSYKETQEEPGSTGELIEIDVKTVSVRVEYSPRKMEGVDPTKAEVVVGAGRGVKKKEDLDMIKELASILGGAWSVTRPLAADYGWADNWIGISGLVISPKLYIAVGISGQPHHIMGVRGAKIIVAINNDESAPIFEEADYGIVGDLYKVVPALIKRLKEKK
jgi:electron transfer flavoprotein alpha subunit